MAVEGTVENPVRAKSYWTDAHRMRDEARVLRLDGEDGVVLDRSIFYPGGGGQPADRGWLSAGSGRVDVVSAADEPDGAVLLRLAGSNAAFPVGAAVAQEIDGALRLGHMRAHTALHLLTVVLPYPVTGGQIADGKGRLDFKMPAAPDKAAVEDALAALVARDLSVSSEWITAEVFARHTDLVKTLAVQPPAVGGHVRLVRIGSGEDQVDLQPCGGTHVARTGEIGTIRLGKVENKGRDNRRVTISVA